MQIISDPSGSGSTTLLLTSHPVLPFHIPSCSSFSHPILFRLIMSCPVIPCHVLSCHSLSCSVPSRLVMFLPVHVPSCSGWSFRLLLCLAMLQMVSNLDEDIRAADDQEPGGPRLPQSGPGRSHRRYHVSFPDTYCRDQGIYFSCTGFAIFELILPF
jgi:hypothetical protein